MKRGKERDGRKRGVAKIVVILTKICAVMARDGGPPRALHGLACEEER